jgi:PAS domain S-box-containing protein
LASELNGLRLTSVTIPSDQRVVNASYRLARAVSIGTVLIALTVLWSWAHGITRVTPITGGLVAMNPFTAIAVMLLGIALGCMLASRTGARIYTLGRLLAFGAGLMGVIRLIQHAVGAPVSFDQWLFHLQLNGNHIAPTTALEMFLCGLALWGLDRETPKHKRYTEILAFLIISIAQLAIMGHFYRVVWLTRIHPDHQPMALTTSIAFLLLGFGLLFARPERGLMRVISSDSPGGVTARFLLPAAYLIPIVLGYLRLEGERRGLYGMEFSAASFAISTLVISSTLIWWVSLTIYKIDAHRRLADEESRETRLFLESVVENLPNMIFIKDAEHLRFVRFNKAGEELLGFARADLLGKSDYDFFPKEQADFFVTKDRLVLESKKLHDIPEEPIDTPRGQRILHTKKIPICNKKGDPAYLLGISEDITDRKKTEEELQQGRKLQAVGQLAAGIAHQINNPLSVVLGFAQVLLHRIEPDHPFYNAAKSIERETLRCTGLVHDLLSFSRQKGVSMNPVNPQTIIDSALSLIESQEMVRKIKLIQDIPGGLPDFEVDAQQIQQVLINLCLNAMDAMPQGGTLKIQAAVSQGNGSGPGDCIEFCVTDTGQGIPADVQPRIFDPFFTTKPVGKGTGLGLSLCYGIVKSHHGQISMQSEVGKGTTFIVRIPLHAHQANPPDSQSHAA